MLPSNSYMNPSRPPYGHSGIEESRKTEKSSSVVLTLILLGIIGYAGYALSPVLDVWQRMHQPAETTETPVKASSGLAANSGRLNESDTRADRSVAKMRRPWA